MYRTSHWRRGVGILVCGAPVFVLIASMVRAGGGASMTGTVAMIAALAIAVLNVYLSAVRPHVFRRRHGSLDGFRNISSIPLLGSLVTVVGAIVGFGSGVCAALGLLAVGLDVGGSPWLVIATWRDASFWDRPRGPVGPLMTRGHSDGSGSACDWWPALARTPPHLSSPDQRRW